MCRNIQQDYSKSLRNRMKSIGIGYPALSGRSGVSVAELKRIFSGKRCNPTLDTLRAVARALGVEFRIHGGVEIVHQCSAGELREKAARRKAEKLVNLVQGTSALEAQAVGPEVRNDMVNQTVHELMAGPPRKLWAP